MMLNNCNNFALRCHQNIVLRFLVLSPWLVCCLFCGARFFLCCCPFCCCWTFSLYAPNFLHIASFCCFCHFNSPFVILFFNWFVHYLFLALPRCCLPRCCLALLCWNHLFLALLFLALHLLV